MPANPRSRAEAKSVVLAALDALDSATPEELAMAIVDRLEQAKLLASLPGRRRVELLTPAQHLGSVGGFVSWANTADRTARTNNARAKGPNAVEWHMARLTGEYGSEAERREAGERARTDYYRTLAAKSAAARQQA